MTTHNLHLTDCEIVQFHTLSLSVKEIAFKLGFSSPSYFSRIFRKFYGRTPSRDSHLAGR